jgi:hypothetical protein
MKSSVVRSLNTSVCIALQQHLKFPLPTPQRCVGWFCTHSLWGSPRGNNHSDLCLVNMVARTTHTWSTLEIDSTGHCYQTHHAGWPRLHSLYVGMYHPASLTQATLLCMCADLCLPTTSFLLLQLIQTYVPDGWLQILLVRAVCWISSENVFALSQNYWFHKMFWQWTHALPHCMLSCTVYTANSGHSFIQW